MEVDEGDFDPEGDGEEEDQEEEDQEEEVLPPHRRVKPSAKIQQSRLAKVLKDRASQERSTPNPLPGGTRAGTEDDEDDSDDGDDDSAEDAEGGKGRESRSARDNSGVSVLVFFSFLFCVLSLLVPLSFCVSVLASWP